MKVTVCFGDVRILVPCGSGELLVRDLISEATRRYKKAAGKVSSVHTLTIFNPPPPSPPSHHIAVDTLPHCVALYNPPCFPSGNAALERQMLLIKQRPRPKKQERKETQLNPTPKVERTNFKSCVRVCVCVLVVVVVGVVVVIAL